MTVRTSIQFSCLLFGYMALCF